MLFVITFLSLVFIGLAFLLNERNASTLLSGYNTMSEEGRKHFNLKGFLRHYKAFHLVLAISFALIGIPLTVISPNAGGVFMATYPIGAYIWFISTTGKYYDAARKAWRLVSIVILSIVLGGVVLLFVLGFRDDKLEISKSKIHLSGMYSEVFNIEQIKSVQVVDELPDVVMKTNGFALGAIKKGYFKTNKGEMIKLVVTSNEGPYLEFIKTDDKRIYYASREDEKILYETIILTLQGGASKTTDIK